MRRCRVIRGQLYCGGLGLHDPSDVLAATLIGSGLASVMLWLVPGVSLF